MLTGPDSILQTIYDDDEEPLEAIALDAASGKIATCSGANVRVYKPYGQGEDALKVGSSIMFLQRQYEADTFSGHCNTASTSKEQVPIMRQHSHGA